MQQMLTLKIIQTRFHVLERWNEINSEERGVNPVEQSINAMPRDAREIVKSPEYHTAFMKALAKRDLTSNEQSMLREMRGTATITTAETGLGRWLCYSLPILL
jgi:hypothetical protein